MKGLMILFAVLSYTMAPYYPFNKTEKPHEIGNQLSSLLTYPDVLGANGGIIMIQFSLGEGNAIGNVKVYTNDDELNSELIRQLTGKKIHVSDFRPAERFTVKLRFVSNK